MEAAQTEAQKSLIANQAQRDKLGELEHEAGFRLEQMNAREREAAQVDLQSKLTFADISVLDKAVPPAAPSFPKPAIVVPVAIGGGLALGIILALLSEMTDRRVRFPSDLKFAASAPLLGVSAIRPTASAGELARRDRREYRVALLTAGTGFHLV